jgi:hypothetical protein
MPSPFILAWRRAVASEHGPAPVTRHVLLTLSLYMDNRGGKCFPTTRELATATGLSERSVCTHLSLADEAGWIERRLRGVKGREWKSMEYVAATPDALNDIQHANGGGTEGDSARQQHEALNLTTRGTEPHDIKALNDVQSNSKRELSTNSPDHFEEAWRAYPSRSNNSKAAARKAWAASVKRGADPATMLEGARRYAAWIAAEGTAPQYVKLAATFFGPGEHWLSDYTPTNGNGNSRTAGEQSLYLRPSDLAHE